MNKDWDGIERRRTWGSGYESPSKDCPVDPECFFRTKLQVEINTKKLETIEAQMASFLHARDVADGVVKGSKATFIAAILLVVVSVSMVISLLIALISGKVSISDFIKFII